MRRREPRTAPCPRAGTWGALAGCLLLAGCVTWSESFRNIERHLAQGQYDEALAALERQGGAQRDQALTLLNKGMVLRMVGDFRASNEALEAAKGLMEELSAISLREQAATFIINDAAHAYVSEEHEQVLVHLYQALNYIALGDLDNARVEALQVDLKLRQQAERRKDDYIEAAFARYLTGMIYEDLGEWSDAMIAYRKSYEAYLKYPKLYSVNPPQALKFDLLRLAQHLGLTEELRRYRKEFGIEQLATHEQWREQGELVFLLHNGLAPAKREHSVAVIDPGSGHVVRISLPYYDSRPAAVSAARLTAADHQGRTEVFEDVQAIARRTLEARLPAITARSIARAVVKGAVSRVAREGARDQKSGGDALAAAVVGLGVEIAGVLTERADTRSWATLPHNIQLARLALPPGTYTVKVELLGYADQSIGGFELREVVITPGRKTYLSRHWTASHAATAWRRP